MAKKKKNPSGIDLTPEEMEMEQEFEHLAEDDLSVESTLEEVQQSQAPQVERKSGKKTRVWSEDIKQHPKFDKFKKGEIARDK